MTLGMLNQAQWHLKNSLKKDFTLAGIVPVGMASNTIVRPVRIDCRDSSSNSRHIQCCVTG